jgi:hypothetical protein
MTKRIKVFLTNNRSEEIELAMPISAENWLVATRHDGGKFVVLNGRMYTKAEIVDAQESRIVRTDMDGV